MKKHQADQNYPTSSNEEILQKISKEERTPDFMRSILMRDRKKKQTKLHLLYQDSTKNVETEMAVPEPFTEIIGWHAGNEVVGLKKTPEC